MYYRRLKRAGQLIILFITSIIVGCASDQNSGLESYNRSMYQINKSIDKYTLKPIAKGYRAVTPDVVEKRVSHFFGNLSEVGTFTNSLLQGKLHNAAVSSARIVWNSTIGIGGLFDVATAMDLHSNKEDFGQTLQTWGMPAGPYVVLPFFGPSTVTDSVGLVGDYFISPLYWYDDWSDHSVREGVIALSIIDKRVRLLDTEKMLENVNDEYSFVKSAYLQQRALLVNDGKVENSELEADLDDLYGD